MRYLPVLALSLLAATIACAELLNDYRDFAACEFTSEWGTPNRFFIDDDGRATVTGLSYPNDAVYVGDDRFLSEIGVLYTITPSGITIDPPIGNILQRTCEGRIPVTHKPVWPGRKVKILTPDECVLKAISGADTVDKDLRTVAQAILIGPRRYEEWRPKQ
jgi:hypothetical protein